MIGRDRQEDKTKWKEQPIQKVKSKRPIVSGKKSSIGGVCGRDEEQ